MVLPQKCGAVGAVGLHVLGDGGLRKICIALLHVTNVRAAYRRDLAEVGAAEIEYSGAGALGELLEILDLIPGIGFLNRRTTVSRVRGDYFQDGRVPTGTTTITKRGDVTR